jgi:hypothetical protein
MNKQYDHHILVWLKYKNPTEPFGTPAYLLAKTEDPFTSHLAAQKVNTSINESRIHKAIVSAGEYGLTKDELLRCFGFNNPSSNPIDRPHYSSILGPIAALLRKSYIYRKGDTRKGDRNRAQLINRALTDEARLSIQAQNAEIYKYALANLDIEHLSHWFLSNEQLQRAQEYESRCREYIASKIIPNVPIRDYWIPLENNFYLRISFKKGKAQFRIEKE